MTKRLPTESGVDSFTKSENACSRRNFYVLLTGLILLNIVYALIRKIPLLPVLWDMGGNYPELFSLRDNLISYGNLILSGVPLLDLIVGISILISMIPDRIFKNRLKRINFPQSFWTYAIAILAVISLSEYLLTMYFFSETVPHVSDESGYLYQAKILASGKLYTAPPELPQLFPSPMMVIYNNKYFSQYTLGHPIVLSLGYLLGLPWVIPPSCKYGMSGFGLPHGKYDLFKKNRVFCRIFVFCIPFRKNELCQLHVPQHYRPIYTRFRFLLSKSTKVRCNYLCFSDRGSHGVCVFNPAI